MRGLVSTIIAVYNRPKLLIEAVESVLAQNYRPIEIVIVDDGSTDDTLTVARSLAAKWPEIIRVHQQGHVFCTAAWNTGLTIITGEFVQFLDSDDVLMPEKFAMQVEALQAHPDCGLSYCYVHEHPFGQPRSGQPARHTGKTFPQLFPQLLASKIWPSPSPLYRRDVIDAAGPFLDVRVQPDWEWESRVGATGIKLHHCKAFLGETRGTHVLEGRTKGGVPAGKSGDYVRVLDRILSHAVAAGMPKPALDILAPKLFAAARICAIEGNERDAERALTLARSVSRPSRRLRLSLYAGVSATAGSAVAAHSYDRATHHSMVQLLAGVGRLPVRVARYGIRRQRDLAQFVRGRHILRKYSAHYRQGRGVYAMNGHSTAPVSGSLLGEGLLVTRPGDADATIPLSGSHVAALQHLASDAAQALDQSRRCRFVPAVTTATLPERTEQIPEVASGEVITAQLLDPLTLEGLADLCDPIIEAIERAIYHSFVLVDKVYVYRSLVTEQAPRASWLWHYDNHPREMLKVMIYLTDVTDTTAPFEYLVTSDGRPVMGRPLAPLYGGSRISASAYDRLLAEGHQTKRVTGPRGTLIAFDDNIVHRATLASTGHRDVVVLQLRPALQRMTPRIDARWTGTFGHHDFNVDPYDVTPRLKP